MANIRIEDFDARRHHNPMAYIDDGQAQRSSQTRALVPYKVCLVDVCGFEFTFHSLTQLELCLEYYRRAHHASSRIPFETGNYGGDHWETQRWFEKLPNYLLEKGKRPKVVSALERALVEYQRHEGAETRTAKPSLNGW
jgi:hypothetical protein